MTDVYVPRPQSSTIIELEAVGGNGATERCLGAHGRSSRGRGVTRRSNVDRWSTARRGRPRGPGRLRVVRRPPGLGGRVPDDAGRPGHRSDRTIGLRQVHLLAPAQPDARAGARVRHGGRDPPRRRGHLRGHQRAQVIRTRIGMVFQKPNPFPAMSVRDNVLAGLKLTKLRCTDHDALVERVAPAGRPVARSARSARTTRVARSRVASSSGSASRGRWRSPPTCCSWTSPARPSTPRRPGESKRPSRSCVRT